MKSEINLFPDELEFNKMNEEIQRILRGFGAIHAANFIQSFNEKREAPIEPEDDLDDELDPNEGFADECFEQRIQYFHDILLSASKNPNVPMDELKVPRRLLEIYKQVFEDTIYDIDREK